MAQRYPALLSFEAVHPAEVRVFIPVGFFSRALVGGMVAGGQVGGVYGRTRE
jgi:hypothetical protein